MNGKKIFLLLLIVFTTKWSFSQDLDREGFLTGNFYQIATVSGLKYKNKDGSIVNVPDITTGDLAATINMDYGDYLYFEADLSLGANFIKLNGADTVTSFGAAAGFYLFKDNPISITSNSNLIFGLGGMFDARYISLDDGLAGTGVDRGDLIGNFSTYGGEFFLDYQLGEWLNAKPLLSYGLGGSAKKTEFNCRVAVKPFESWSLWFTVTPSFAKFSSIDGQNENKKIDGDIQDAIHINTFMFGLGATM